MNELRTEENRLLNTEQIINVLFLEPYRIAYAEGRAAAARPSSNAS